MSKIWVSFAFFSLLNLIILSPSIQGTVETPTYHYDRNPEVIYTILGQCWRLHYLKCGLAESASHPCCQGAHTHI